MANNNNDKEYWERCKKAQEDGTAPGTGWGLSKFDHSKLSPFGRSAGKGQKWFRCGECGKEQIFPVWSRKKVLHNCPCGGTMAVLPPLKRPAAPEIAECDEVEDGG
jgi:hypothetical protein